MTTIHLPSAAPNAAITASSIAVPTVDPGTGRSRSARRYRFRSRSTDLTSTSATANPPWFSPLRAALLLATAVSYLWTLGASGWANAYYSAAAQAGASSWKAWFFGSFDSANAITVDKPPASMWVMGLSARIFGVSSWSILVPEALMGVATVALIVAMMRRWFRPSAALIAGAIMAFTPVAVLMFRFNNPDALLMLLLTAGAYAMIRAIESAHTKWLVLAGTLVGFGFLTKMMQAFIVLPAFGLAYLLAAPTTLRRRIAQGVAMGVATLVSAGWWVAAVELWPKSSRPYIGGSQKNSVIELIFGYNGFGRLTGNETGSVGGGATQGGNWGKTGILRMFNSQFGSQIAWLLPAALIAMVVGLVATARRNRLDRTRAALVMWGLWLVITGLIFSLGQGIIHEYYSVALAPAIAALVGIGVSLAIDHRNRIGTRLILAGTILATSAWSVALLLRTSSWNPWLRTLIAVTGALGAAGVLFFGQRARLARAAAGLALIAVLAGPVSYSVATTTTAHTGSLPTAGPSSGGGMGGGMGGPGGFGGRGNGAAPGTFGAPGAFGGPSATTGTAGTTTTGTPPTGATGMGGLLNASSASEELVSALKTDAGSYRWVAAAVGANSAAGYQLASDEPVLAIGGFNGSDPAPSLEEFQALVANGDIHYFIAGGGMGGGMGAGQMGGSNSSSSISSWVTSNYTATTIGGTTVYDLSTTK